MTRSRPRARTPRLKYGCADRAFVRAPARARGGVAQIHSSRSERHSRTPFKNSYQFGYSECTSTQDVRPALSRHTGSWLGGGMGSPIRSLPQSGTKGGSRVYNMGSDGAEAHACAPARHPCPTPASPTPAAEAKQKRAVSHGAAASCIDTSLARSLHGHTHLVVHNRRRTARAHVTPRPNTCIAHTWCS